MLIMITFLLACSSSAPSLDDLPVDEEALAAEEALAEPLRVNGFDPLALATAASGAVIDVDMEPHVDQPMPPARITLSEQGGATMFYTECPAELRDHIADHTVFNATRTSSGLYDRMTMYKDRKGKYFVILSVRSDGPDCLLSMFLSDAW